MFEKVLVANRGEIALRIIRACKELGIKTVAVHSEADANSLHVRFADEDVCIGPPPPSASYNNISAILSAVEVTNADAVHPGYGFLAENPLFAEICEACGITFIGPPSHVLSRMGDKAEARRTMERAGVPVVPGSRGPVEDLDEAKEVAEEVGYPIMLKAVWGGGGRGMRVVQEPEELEKAWHVASSEAQASFSNPALYVERYIERPRHIEVQILADRYGKVVHLGERECSIQRRHQKLIEESPSPAVGPELRERLGEAAVRGAKEVGYCNAGTVEFLLDEDGNFYFIEMNTRIQVEHPVTEMVTGVDIVKAQILIAAGEPLTDELAGVSISGHAIECRINAEDPEKDFMPSSGMVTGFHAPGGPGIRVDTHIYASYKVPPYYDSLLAKLIAWGHTREEALSRMERALDEFVIEGVPTTLPLHRAILRDHRFREGDVDVDFLENFKMEGWI